MRRMEQSQNPGVQEEALLPFLESTPFHAKSPEHSLEFLNSRISGLSQDDITNRQARFGKNAIEGQPFKAGRQLFLHQFKNIVVILLIVAAILSFVMGKINSGLTILVVMLLNIGVGMLTQWKAQKSEMTLNEFTTITCDVKRSKQILKVPAAELVPGDILVLNTGQVIPADARLIFSDNLQMDESMLTGESILVNKDAKALHIPDEEATEQSNMVFAGTRVKIGKGEAVVTATGAHTIMGQIAALARSTRKQESPFIQGINRLGRRAFMLVFILAAMMVALGFQRGDDMLMMLQLGIILAVAAFPETLPGIATLILSMGIDRLSHENVVVKNLRAVESIGDVSVICSDKTGTLTENYLSLEKLYLPETGQLAYDPQWKLKPSEIPTRSLEEFLRIARMNNTTGLEGIRSAIMGDPIDVALYRAASPELATGYHRIKEMPFDPVTLKSVTVVEGPEGQILSMIKGAPEKVIETCAYYMRADGTAAPMSEDQKIDFILINREMAFEESLRIIGFAEKMMLNAEDDPFEGAVFVGWVCLIDPPKQGVVEAVQSFHEAGVNIMMITGDQKATAAITAEKLGILQEGSDIWTRHDLEAEGVDRIPDNVHVFARTKPEEKLAIVESLQKSGQTVAMVGDGVNDAPALQKSDIAIAMGISGAEAAKESADIILLTDRLEGIMNALLESRMLKSKIRMCVQYLMSCNLALVFLVAMSSLLGKGLALNVVQILWLNLITVSIPAITLAIEPSDPDDYKDTHTRGGPLNPKQTFLVFYWSLLMALGGFAVYLMGLLTLDLPSEAAGTLAFTTMALAQTLNLLNLQFAKAGGRLHVFLSEVVKVPITWLVMFSALGIHALTLFVPFLQDILGTVTVDPLYLLIAAGVALGSMVFAMMTVDLRNMNQ